jgi:hypothetical protein
MGIVCCGCDCTDDWPIPEDWPLDGLDVDWPDDATFNSWEEEDYRYELETRQKPGYTRPLSRPAFSSSPAFISAEQEEKFAEAESKLLRASNSRFLQIMELDEGDYYYRTFLQTEYGTKEFDFYISEDVWRLTDDASCRISFEVMFYQFIMVSSMSPIIISDDLFEKVTT